MVCRKKSFVGKYDFEDEITFKWGFKGEMVKIIEKLPKSQLFFVNNFYHAKLDFGPKMVTSF